MPKSPDYKEFDVTQFLKYADLGRIRCIDEREFHPDSNGVQIPGATYGLVDAVKSIVGCSEEEAWEMVLRARVPLGAHEHCAYASKVETNPSQVGAGEKISTSTRLRRVRQYGGEVLHYLGEHKPNLALLNFKFGYTLDTNLAMGSNVGIFNCDVWTAGEFGSMIRLPGHTLQEEIISIFRKTIHTIAPNIPIDVIS